MPRDTVSDPYIIIPDVEVTSCRSVEARAVPEAEPVDEVLDALIKARAHLLDERNWCGYGAMDISATGHVSRCAVMTVATITQPDERQLRCLDALKEHLPAGFDSIADFNDEPSTTHADILALFDRAIEARAPASRGDSESNPSRRQT